MIQGMRSIALSACGRRMREVFSATGATGGDHRAEGAIPRLEALLVGVPVGVEVLLEGPVDGLPLGWRGR